ncbi:unnamed protein product [Coregonus sp. 'balchen']|nr:unnamed protein product [Coregonus sp. 'balchen']
MLSLVQESGDAKDEEEDEDKEKTDKEKSRGKTKKQWWRPWVDHASMVRSGNYYLFETDSEEEEEEEDKKEEETPKKSAFQFVYHAWITDSKTAMKERSKEKRHFWKKYTEGSSSKPRKDDLREDNILKRVFNIVKFSWVLFLAMLDSFTAWINSMCQEHLDISTVLRIERCMLTHEVKKGNKPSRESIHVYYRKQMCKAASIESGLERTEEETCQDCIPHKAERQSCAYLESQDSLVSHDSLSSVYTENTLLCSCRSTLDHTEMGPDSVQMPRTSERAHPKLCKMEDLDLESTSSADSGGSQASEHTQCTTTCSRQGTTDTIKETGEKPGQDLQDPQSSYTETPSTSTSMGLYLDHEWGLLSRSRGMDWDSRDSVLEAERAGWGRGPCYAHHSELQLYQADPSGTTPTDTDIPPSYSRATGLNREGAEQVSSSRTHHEKRLVVVTPDEKSDFLSGVTSTTFPSLTHELTANDLLRNRMFYDEELEDSERFYGNQPALLQLLYALYNMLVAHSEMVCFLVIILNHMISASVATLVLPILIFLWAMLSVPRPSKRFWMTAIVYTEVTIVIKYFFQFGFFPFNQNIELDKSKPFHPPNIIGVEKKEGYVHYDLVQLLALFFHRSILKCHGLWDEDDPRGGGGETPKQHHHDREKRSSSRRVEKQASGGSISLLESVRARFPHRFHSLSTSTQLCRKSSSSASHLSQRTLRSGHSRGDSVSSRHSLRRGGSLRRGDSMLSVQQRSKKERILEKLREQLIKAKCFTVKKTLEIYVPIRQFFYNLIHPEYSAVTDVYVLMFLADTKHSAAADITSSLSEDQVPEAFLVMVLIQFGTMIIDRALYLRKTVMGKVIFQVILVFGIHFWMFFILPGVTERSAVATPPRVLGNFLTKSYNYLNLFLFQGFRLVPFLTELRAVMDWVWTDTTLSLSSWICVEDIYAHIFVLKCWRMSEKGTTDTIKETGEKPGQDLQDPQSSYTETPSTSTSMGLYLDHEWGLLSRSRGMDWDSRDSVLEAERAGWGRGPCYAHHSELQLYQADPSGTTPTDTDIPPSYSRATGLNREGAEQVSSSRTHHEKRLVVVTPDEKSDFLSGVTSTTFPSLTHELTANDLLRNRMFYDEELEDSERFYGNQPALLQLLYALYNMLVAHSEMVCFLVIILNHMISASVATLVLPILIFLWAMLSVPRPSKRFWMTAIVYTEVTIVIKYFFQFGFFPFNQNIELDKSKPFHPPNIIGVEKKEGYVHYDLVQLLALFFHRSILKCHGLWDEDDPRGGGGETPKQHHHDREKRSSSRRVEKQASGGSISLLESVRARFPHRFHSLSTSTQLCRKSSSSASHLSQRTLRSGHSRGDSVSSRHSLRRGGSLRRGDSMLSVQQRSKKERILEKLREQLIKAKCFTVKKTLEIYVPIRQFFYNLIHPEYSAVTDVYVLMFLADTVDFIIIKHSAAADITSSLSEDQVPEAFLVMVLIQFGTMIIDRALYLRKTVMGKVIFQVILVFGIHFWMFFILPGVTERRFSKNTVAQLWYFVKCIYFGLSAYQIRCGYPTRVLGNFLTKSYNYLNLFLFQGFRLVPFLTELRAVMDWVWTDTTLSLSSWICVEDIYAHIFVLKCWRMSEKRYPQPRGQKKKKVVKYGMGGLIVMLLICIVWFPLLFMSLVKSVAGVVNKPLDVSPIFTMSAQQNQLKDISKADFVDFMNSYNYIPSAMQFLEAYTSEDVTVAELEGSSNSLVIEQVFPCFLRAPSDSNAKPIEQLYKDNGYKNILLDLERTHNSSGEIQEWWIVDQPSAGQIQMRGAAVGKKREAGLQLYVFSDKVSPPSLGFLAGYGGISHSIMFEELPAVDRILKLCTDIFLVRETGELELEEDLYAKLIFLYRSPETMIKWTRDQKTK